MFNNLKRKLKHFPLRRKLLIKKHYKGFVKLGGSIIFIILLGFYIASTYDFFYYSQLIQRKEADIAKTTINISLEQLNNKKDIILLECYKKQFERVENGRKIEIGYCK